MEELSRSGPGGFGLACGEEEKIFFLFFFEWKKRVTDVKVESVEAHEGLGPALKQ